MSVKNPYGGSSAEYKLGVYNLDFGCDKSKPVRFLFFIDKSNWVEAECSFDVHKILKTVDGLLKPVLLSDSIELFKKAEQMKDSNINMDMVDFYRDGGIPYREILKNKLQSLIDTL